MLVAFQNAFTGQVSEQLRVIGASNAEAAEIEAARDVVKNLAEASRAKASVQKTALTVQLKNSKRHEARAQRNNIKMVLANDLFDNNAVWCCAFVNDRNEICSRDAVRAVPGFEVEGFPHTPRFCTRHLTMLTNVGAVRDNLHARLVMISVVGSGLVNLANQNAQPQQQPQGQPWFQPAQQQQGPQVEEVQTSSVEQDSELGSDSGSGNLQMDVD